MVGRILFASFCIALIVASLLAGYTGWSAVIAAGLIIGLVVLGLWIAVNNSDEAEERVGDGLAVVMGTNNRWLASLFCLFVLSIAIAAYNGFGPPTVLEYAEKQMSETGANRPSEIRQRILDRSRGLDPDRKIEEQPKEVRNSWPAFYLRWLCVIILGVALVVYTPVAFSDEFSAAYRKLSRKYGGNDAEGSSGLSWSERISDLFRLWKESKGYGSQAAVAEGPSAQSSGEGFSVKREFGMEVGAEAIVAIIQEIFRRFSRR